MKRYQDFAVTGVANEEVLDAGIASTEVHTKHVAAVLCNLNIQEGAYIVAYVDETEILKIPDYLIDTQESTGSTNTQKSTKKITRIEIDYTLEVGEKLQIGTLSGATGSDLYGAYEYEIV